MRREDVELIWHKAVDRAVQEGDLARYGFWNDAIKLCQTRVKELSDERGHWQLGELLYAELERLKCN